MAWINPTYRHVASSRPEDVVDTTASAVRGSGRWNSRGEHTLYLAGDQALAIAEFARHLEHRPAALVRPLRPRFIFQVDVRLARVIDLRHSATGKALDLDPDPAWIRDLTRTREIARWLRQETETEAIVVPSVAFLDDTSRWNLVVFREKLATWPEPAITVGPITGLIDPAALLGVE